MSDQRPVSGGSPWMRPLSAQQLVRNDTTRRAAEPVGPYTPNEPDLNEAVYAARAQAALTAARQRQAETPAPQTPEVQPVTVVPEVPADESPVEQAMRSTVAKVHTARQESLQQAVPPVAAAAAVYQPAEFFYRQSTGVLQPEPQPAPQPAAPAQPVQPHRLPMAQYADPAQTAAPAAAQSPAPAATGTFASRQNDAAPLLDPMLMEEASQSSDFPHRRAVLMRTQQPDGEDWYAQPAALSEPEETLLDEPVPQAPRFVQTTSAAVQSQTVPEAAPAESPREPEPLFAATPEPASEAAELPPLPQQTPWDADLLQPLMGAEDDDEDDDDSVDDCMDTDTMPIPATISPFLLPQDKPKRRFPAALVLVPLMLAATGVFLWFSGYGEPLWNAAKQLWETHLLPFIQSAMETVKGAFSKLRQ